MAVDLAAIEAQLNKAFPGAVVDRDGEWLVLDPGQLETRCDRRLRQLAGSVMARELVLFDSSGELAVPQDRASRFIQYAADSDDVHVLLLKTAKPTRPTFPVFADGGQGHCPAASRSARCSTTSPYFTMPSTSVRIGIA